MTGLLHIDQLSSQSSSMTSSSTSGNSLVAFSNSLAEVIARVGQSVVAVNARRRSSCSGIHWRSGIIVTSAENLKHQDEITVTLPEGQPLQVTLVGRDRSTDIAVLKLPDAEALSLPVAVVDPATSLQVGQMILAVGRLRDHGLTARLGIISVLGAAWHSMMGGLIDQFIRLDLNLDRTLAGGALVDTEGCVVGMNTTGSRGQALTIPASTVNRVLEQLLTTGRIERGYLGLGMQAVLLPVAFQQSLALSATGGVMVVNLDPGGPADQGGVMLGDIVIAVDGQTVTDPGDIQAMLGMQQPGRVLPLTLIRGGSLIELTVTLGDRPSRST
jgi:S1-C subfamily serine protease